MANTLKLKGLIAGSGLSRKEISQKMGISLYSLYKKINNETEFKASEIKHLTKILDIKQVDEVFFN